MIRQIAPQLFTLDIPGTLAYCEDKLGFKCLGTWQDPPVYAIVARDHGFVPALNRPRTRPLRTGKEVAATTDPLPSRELPYAGTVLG
jgi:hypothetical protein